MPRFKPVPLLGTYINDYNNRFHRICQITAYTAYVMLIEAGLTDVEKHFAEANPEPWLTNDFSNCFMNKGFALVDIHHQALVLYKHDDRWWLYHASPVELARFLHKAMLLTRPWPALTRPWPAHVAAACKLLDLDPEDEGLGTKIRTRLLKMIEGAERRSA